MSAMQLIAYIQEQRGRAAALAAALKVRPVMVHMWAHGKKPVPVARCAQIEEATSGAVTRVDLRPDDYGIYWPELRVALVAPTCAPDVQMESVHAA